MFSKIIILGLSLMSVAAWSQEVDQKQKDTDAAEYRHFKHEEKHVASKDPISTMALISLAKKDDSGYDLKSLTEKFNHLSPEQQKAWSDFVAAHRLNQRSDDLKKETPEQHDLYFQHYSRAVLDAMIAEGKNPSIFSRENLEVTMSRGAGLGSPNIIVTIVNRYASIVSQGSYKGRPALRNAALRALSDLGATEAQARKIYEDKLNQWLFVSESVTVSTNGRTP